MLRYSDDTPAVQKGEKGKEKRDGLPIETR